MQTFKKGQRVWWNDPIHEKSGEYDVLDPQDKLNAGKPEQERSILIGNGEDTWDSPAEYLTIVFPISFVARHAGAPQQYMRQGTGGAHAGTRRPIRESNLRGRKGFGSYQRRGPRRLLRLRISCVRWHSIRPAGLR